MRPLWAGNSRFELFLDMRKQDFLNHPSRRGIIINEVIDSVTSHYHPPGRFLLVDGIDLTELKRETVFHFVRVSLEQKIQEDSLPVSPGEPLPLNDEFTPLPIDDYDSDVAYRNKRRIPSLLTREAISLILGNENIGNTEDHRKRPAMENIDLKSLDVIMDYDTGALIDGRVGNARFEILLDMSRRKFNEAEVHERDKIITDLIGIVSMNWKGRFLYQKNDKYLFIPAENMVDRLAHLLTTPFQPKKLKAEISSSSDDWHNFIPGELRSDIEDLQKKSVTDLIERKERYIANSLSRTKRSSGDKG